jgi:predicted ATPase/DNA-binding SARP family transcriptional activator
VSNRQTGDRGDTAAPAGLAVRLLGGFEATVDGCPLGLRSRSDRWLLALLVLQRGRAVERYRLAQTLWPFPDHAADAAAYNLRRSLACLRKALGGHAWRLDSAERGTLRLDPVGAQVDVIEFEAALRSEQPDELERAVALYSGPLLPECTQPWALSERSRLEAALLDALESLGREAKRRGDMSRAILLLRRATEICPERESARRDLMRLLAQAGEINTAIACYQELCEALRLEGAAPDPETTRLFREIRAAERAGSHPSPAESSPIPRGARLPQVPSSVIGRSSAIAEVEAAIGRSRLLTLTGAGGVGKTTLALTVAEGLASEFRDGAVFVDLAGLTDEARVAEAAASALRLPERPGLALIDSLAAALEPARMLILLDNCEHLIAAAAQLAEAIFERCPHVRILATSRRPLGIRGEFVWRVPSLPSPDPAALPADSEALCAHVAAFDAIRLFVERAGQADATFRLTPQNAAAVTTICARLDGIPLAIELAAARTGALTPAQIAARLSRRFELLTGGPRGALSRQQTLEAMVRWSFDLLEPAEREMLCALSVCAGAWSVETAERLAPDPSAALDLVAALVDRSVVTVDDTPSRARYRLPETTRQFARERLAESGGTGPAVQRHAAAMLALAEAAERELDGADGDRWLDRLAAEQDDLRTALEWAVSANGNAEAALRLASASWHFWYRKGLLSAGRGYLEAALAHPGAGAHPAAVATACIGAGKLAWFQSDWEAGRGYLRRSLETARDCGDPDLVAGACDAFAQIAWDESALPEAREYLEEALRLRRASGNTPAVAKTLSFLGVVACDQGDDSAARGWLEEGLGIGRALNDDVLIANALHCLAHRALYAKELVAARALYAEVHAIACRLQDRMRMAVALHRMGSVEVELGELAPARARLEESLQLAAGLDDKNLMVAAVNSLAGIARAEGDIPAARTLCRDRLQLYRELGDRAGLCRALRSAASLCVAAGHPEDAAVLLAASTAIQPPDKLFPEDTETIAAVQSALSAETLAAMQALGGGHSPDRAVRFALEALAKPYRMLSTGC